MHNPWSLLIKQKLHKLTICPYRTVCASLIHPNQIIEECEERFTQEKLEQLVEIVQTTLPRDDDQEMAEQTGEFNDEIADGEEEEEEEEAVAEDESMDE